MQRLWLLWAGMLASTGVYALIVIVMGAPAEAPAGDGEVLAWVLGTLSAVNLATVAPLLRVMLDRAQRGAADGRVEHVLPGHLAAMVVAWARVELVALCGLALYFAAARTDYFWAFMAVSAVGLLLLRPTAPPVGNVASADGGAPPVDP